MTQEILINKEKVTHLIITSEFEGVHKKYKIKYYWLEDTPDKVFWIKVETYPAGFYANGSTSNLSWGRKHYGEYKPDYTLEDVENSEDTFIKQSLMEVNKNGGVYKKSIWTKPSVEVYTGGTLLKTFYFDSIQQGRNFCHREFKNIKTIEK